MQDCVLCNEVGGKLIFKNDLFRVISVASIDYPGFIRIITNAHFKEMTDLNQADAIKIMAAVLKIESVVRKVFKPDKINLASLGNLVSHVHWHIIPRYLNDKHYPNPIWGAVTNPEYIPDNSLARLQSELSAQLNQTLVDK